MVNVSIARRYARALLEAAGPQGDDVLKQLESLSAALELSPELADVLSNPAYSHASRHAVVAKLIALTGVGVPALQNLLKLLVDRSRFMALPDIARIYRDLVDVRMGRVRGKVTSAVALMPEVLQRLEASLVTVTQKQVVLESSLDPALLGGATAQVGSHVYDGSLKNQLQQIARDLRR